MADGPAKTIEEILTCSLCLELFKNPKTLTCLHSYCADCLKEMTKNTNDAPIPCPLCRDETAMPPEGIDGLPTNFFINNMLEVAQLKSREQDLQCSNCEDGLRAACRCVDCKEFFCQRCLEAHSRLKKNEDHHIVELTKLNSPQGSKDFHPPMKCGRHDLACKFYCRSCDVVVCRDCTVVDHPLSKHTVADLNDIVAQSRERLDEATERAEKRIAEVEKVQVVTKERRLTFEKSLAEISVQLKKRKEHLMQRISETLEGELSTMSSALEKFVSHKMQQDEEDEKQQTAVLRRMGNYRLFIEHLLKSGNNDELMNMYEHLVCCIDDTARTNPFWRDANHIGNEADEVQWFTEPDDEALKNLTDQIKMCIGKLSMPDTGASQYELVHDKGRVHAVGKEVSIKMNCPSGTQVDPTSFGLFTAKVLTPWQTVIPAQLKRHEDGSYSVQFTSYIRGRHRLAVRLGANEVRGSPMSVKVKGDLDYSPGSGILQELPLKKWDEARKTFSLHTNLNGSIYVLSEGRVYVLDQEFNPVYRFGEGGAGHENPVYPVEIEIDRDGRIVLSDIGRHQLLVYDRTGTFIQEIGTRGADPGQLQSPLGIAIDWHGNIAVCDTGNHRIQIFKPDGTFKNSFGNEDKTPMFPVVIEFNSRGHIIVCESSLWTQNYRLLSDSQPVLADYPESESSVECIKIFDRAGQMLRKFGEPGEGKGQFWAPINLAVDSQDHVWVTDFCFGRIQVFDVEGNFVAVHTSDQERKGPGWLSVVAPAANGAMLYYRSYFNNS